MTTTKSKVSVTISENGLNIVTDDVSPTKQTISTDAKGRLRGVARRRGYPASGDLCALSLRRVKEQAVLRWHHAAISFRDS